MVMLFIMQFCVLEIFHLSACSRGSLRIPINYNNFFRHFYINVEISPANKKTIYVILL